MCIRDRECVTGKISFSVNDEGSAQRGRVGQKVMVEIIDLEHRLPLRPIIVQVAGCKERIKINHTFEDVYKRQP